MMEAGRELDARVAEVVMGGVSWSPEAGNILDGSTTILRDFPTQEGCAEYCGARPPHREYGEYKPRLNAPRFSTSIADAWKVVEKLMETRTFHVDTLGFDGEEWRCVIGPREMEQGDWRHIGEADTAPHAICLAALQAMEGQDG